MRAAAEIAVRLQLLPTEAGQRQADLLQALALPRAWPAATEAVVNRLSLDKKRAGSRQRWILADRVGAGRVHDDVPTEIARQAIAAVTEA
jgi:3-dehydroquinate synthetase